MANIRSVSWKKFEKFLLNVGCCFEREKGDHRIYVREDLKRPIVIPRCKSLPMFVIHNNLRLLNITMKEFVEVLNKK